MTTTRRDADRRAKWKKRGIELDDAGYDRLLEAQGGGCALCGATPKKRRLHVDHDHRSGAVRGLLCYRCNVVVRPYVTLRWARALVEYLTFGSRTDGRSWLEALEDGR